MRVFAACLALLGVLLGGSAQARAGRVKRSPSSSACSTWHRPLLSADAQAQVWTVRRPGQTPTVYACAFGQPRSYRLGPVAGCLTGKYQEQLCLGVSHEVLAGPVLAYEEMHTAPGCGFCSWLIRVRDLRTGAILRSVPTGTPSPGASSETSGVGPVRALVDDQRGSVAWVAQTAAAEGTYQVHRADGTGEALLAAGPGIDPTSLALGGRTLYWSDSDLTQSAPIQ